MEGESREMSVLFSDVRGFTTISEGLDPKQLSQLMNEFLTPLTRVIYRHRGTIDKYMGDCIMAFWGAPLSDPQHARNAVLAGLEMQATMEALQPQFHARGWPELHIGVGVNTGRMSVGNMGSEIRVAYTVMGDAVNLASRLEGLTKQYGVGMIVGEDTRAAVPGRRVPRAGPGDAEGQERAGRHLRADRARGERGQGPAGRACALASGPQAVPGAGVGHGRIAAAQPAAAYPATRAVRGVPRAHRPSAQRILRVPAGTAPGPSRRNRAAMQLRILGCSGGIGGNLRTTSMLLDHDVLIDAGTGVGDLTLTELKQIDHIFVTHSHLDHVACIPFLVDTVGGMRDSPITVHATRGDARHPQDTSVQLEDLAGLRRDPESRKRPICATRDSGWARPSRLADARITPLPANHVVPAVGFHLDSGEAQPGVHRRHHDQRRPVGRGQPDREPALSDHRDRVLRTPSGQLAIASKHLTPDLLAEELAKLSARPRIFVSHLKPGEGALTMEEVEAGAGAYGPRMLSNGQVFKF